MINKKIITASVLVLFTCSGYSLTTSQINNSKKALSALDKKDYKSYYYLKTNLRNTSIYPYLQYKEISTNFKEFEPATINKYLTNNKSSYWSQKLTAQLASYYGGENNWPLFHKYYSNNLGVTGTCWEIQSEYDSGQKTKSLEEYGSLWSNRTYMPSSCSTMQKNWDEYGVKKKSYIVNKAYNLAFAGKFDDSLWLLNTYVKDNKDYVAYITAWKNVTKNSNQLDSFILKFHNYRNFNKIFVILASKLVNKNPESFAKQWDELKNKRYLSNKTKHLCISAIAVNFARSQSPQAKVWLNRVDTKYLNTVAWEWLLRVDLYNSNFKEYIETYHKLPKKTQKASAWQYWLAYSYTKIGQKPKAIPIFKNLIKKPADYYSFLASDYLGVKYNFGNVVPKKVSSSELKMLSKDLFIQQSADLYQIGAYKDSSALWKWDVRAKLRVNEKTKIRELSQYAELHHMYYAAIFNMAVLGEYTNLDMLFPNAYAKTVNKNSTKYKVDKDLILSIMRKESLFDVEAGSGAGAKGLMQVTVPTGKFIAKKYKLSLYGDSKKGIDSQIYIPENNIALGTANLDFSIGLFKGNKALGIGAYNAGPGNVAKWLNKNEIPTAQWIESIPYGETRHYIRKVMTYMIIYNNFVFDDKDQKISDYLEGTVSNKLSFR